MRRFIARFVKSSAGVTAMEYGLIAAVAAIAVFSATGSLGAQLNASFNNISSVLMRLGGG